MRRLPLVLIVLAVAALAAVLGWPRLAAPAVEIVEPTRGPAIEAVYATGLVEPSLEIRIASRVAGRLAELRVDEGDEVHRDQLLARLEDRDLRASVAELEARREYAEALHARNLELRRAGLLAQDALERSRTELEAARAALRRAREQLAFTRLEAPASGRIIRRDGEVGEYVPANQVIFHMAGEAPLRITADVDEEDVPRVQPALPVLIRTEAYPGRVFEGRVQQVTPRGDPVARSYRVRIGLIGDPPLQIGMTAETNIVVAERRDALLVPSAAVADGKVWVVRDGRVSARAVTTGVVGPERTEIRAGLAAGEHIVAAAAEGLREGQRVRTSAAATPGAAPAVATAGPGVR